MNWIDLRIVVGRWKEGEEDTGREREMWNEKELSSYGMIAKVHFWNGLER